MHAHMKKDAGAACAAVVASAPAAPTATASPFVAPPSLLLSAVAMDALLAAALVSSGKAMTYVRRLGQC